MYGIIIIRSNFHLFSSELRFVYGEQMRRYAVVITCGVCGSQKKNNEESVWLMCGIAGIVGDEESMEEVLSAMTDAQEHRGRSGRSTWVSAFVDAHVGLAHNRMRLIDEAAGVVLPFVDEETGLVIVLDGEIFNYVELREELLPHYTFRTESMAEVVVKAYHRWGERSLERFEGYFSLAIYNRRDEDLFLARDRFGVKPFYYATQRGNFYFASEIGALFAAGIRRNVSAERWAGYLLYSSYGNPYETFWEGVHQLPPGFLLHYNGYSLCEKRWYSLEEQVEAIEHSDADVLDLFYNQVHTSVSRGVAGRMSRGIYLTGSVDSALLLSSIRQAVSDVSLQVYTHYSGRLQDSDALWSSEMVSSTPYSLEQIRTTSAMARKEAVRIHDWQEEPFEDCAAVGLSSMLRTVSKRGVTVLCNGFGLSEVWGDRLERSPQTVSMYDAEELLNPDFRRLARRPEYPHPFADARNNMRYRQLFYEQIPHILRFLDKIGMYYGLQMRSPFMNHRLVELAFVVAKRKEKDSSLWFDQNVAAPLSEKGFRFAPRRKSAVRNAAVRDLDEWMSDSISEMLHGDVPRWLDGAKLGKMCDNYMSGDDSDVAWLWKCLALHRMLQTLS